MENEIEYLTMQDVKKILQCSDGYIRNLKGNDEFKKIIVKLGRLYRVKRTDFNSFVEHNLKPQNVKEYGKPYS